MWAAIAAIAIPIITGLIGKAESAGDKAEADRIRAKVLEMYGPDALKDVESSSQVGPSAMEGYQADPAAVAYQRQALQRLSEDASTPGLTAAERADMGEAMDETAQYEQGQRGAIMDNARARGVSGSGLELAAQLEGQQGGAMRASQAGRAAAGNAARRRALANLQLGSMAGQFRGQGFDEFGAKARAKDARDVFNANARTGVKMGFLQARAGALGGIAGSKDASGQDTESTWAGTGAAAGRGAATIGQYASNDDDLYQYDANGNRRPKR